MAEESGIELISVPSKWEIPYEYSAGETTSRFLVELRDNERIMATRCPECGQILLPPRSFCATCFVSGLRSIRASPLNLVYKIAFLIYTSFL